MAVKVKADIVLTYPTRDGDWLTLQLSKFQAEYLHDSLEFALQKLNESYAAPVRLATKDTPEEYAL